MVCVCVGGGGGDWGFNVESCVHYILRLAALNKSVVVTCINYNNYYLLIIRSCGQRKIGILYTFIKSLIGEVLFCLSRICMHFGKITMKSPYRVSLRIY